MFHFHGETTTGKTTAAKVAASISRAPDPLPGWNQSPRSLEELAARHRDHVLILNAAEKKAVPKEKARILHALTHEVAEGAGAQRSKVVQEHLPDLTSRSPVLTTANASGAEIAHEVGLKWEKQDQARFISIPVPPLAEGGVVDMADGEDPTAAAALIKRLEEGLRKHYGKALRRWVRRVWTHRDRVNPLIEEFVTKVGVTDPYEKRIARKFGLVYAAGQIAVETRFLRWDKDVPLRATQRLFERALENMEGSHRSRALEALAHALSDPELFPDIGSRNRLELEKNQTFCGLRFTRSGEEFIAIRLQKLPSILNGAGTGDGLVRTLENAGLLAKGHGGKQTQQLNITIVDADGHRLTKPRMLVLQANKVEAFLDDALQAS